MSRATDNEWNGGASAHETASVIESASRMAVIGAVPQMALAASDAAAKAVSSRLGIAQAGMGALSEDYDSGLGLWIMPLYQSLNGFGMEAGNLDHDFSGALGGIALGADMELSGGWSLRPSLDLAVIPAAGDIKAKTRARFTGTSHEIDIKTLTMDWVTYGGTAGLEFAKDNLSLSVFYSGQFGPHSSAHGINTAFRYEF